MKRYLLAYGLWLALAAALVGALAAWYQHSEEITWREVFRRVTTGDVDATDTTEATGSDDGST